MTAVLVAAAGYIVIIYLWKKETVHY
jgi:hypothetical protein